VGSRYQSSARLRFALLRLNAPPNGGALGLAAVRWLTSSIYGKFQTGDLSKAAKNLLSSANLQQE
jgi:hypothetical protein